MSFLISVVFPSVTGKYEIRLLLEFSSISSDLVVHFSVSYAVFVQPVHLNQPSIRISSGLLYIVRYWCSSLAVMDIHHDLLEGGGACEDCLHGMHSLIPLIDLSIFMCSKQIINVRNSAIMF